MYAMFQRIDRQPMLESVVERRDVMLHSEVPPQRGEQVAAFVAHQPHGELMQLSVDPIPRSHAGERVGRGW